MPFLSAPATPGAPGSPLEHLHSCQQSHVPALAGCVPEEESWAAERFAGRASRPVPPHLLTTIHRLLSFLLSCMDLVPLGHSQVEISPEEEKYPLWSAPFPGALLSNFLAPLGTFRLTSPPRSFSFSSCSSGTTKPGEAWTCLPAFSAPARACTCGQVPLTLPVPQLSP